MQVVTTWLALVLVFGFSRRLETSYWTDSIKLNMKTKDNHAQDPPCSVSIHGDQLMDCFCCINIVSCARMTSSVVIDLTRLTFLRSCNSCKSRAVMEVVVGSEHDYGSIRIESIHHCISIRSVPDLSSVGSSVEFDRPPPYAEHAAYIVRSVILYIRLCTSK